MWTEIIFKAIILGSFIRVLAEMDRNKEGSLHMAAICISGILALAGVVIFS
jgi:hypothetical protein